MKRLVLAASALLVLFGAACSPTTPPPPDQPQEDEVQVVEAVTATPPPGTSTATPEPLAPIVLNYVPEPGQEQPLDQPIEITFDQPMDQDSVEKAFAIEPGASVDGTFTWSNDNRTVEFALKDGFERSQRYKVRRPLDSV